MHDVGLLVINETNYAGSKADSLLLSTPGVEGGLVLGPS